jgi:hypothetical protein
MGASFRRDLSSERPVEPIALTQRTVHHRPDQEETHAFMFADASCSVNTVGTRAEIAARSW